MGAPLRAPAPRPCKSCPYRVDAPVGLWDDTEYDKLPGYDEPSLPAQPTGAFGCHQADGRLCAGWVATHDMRENLALRIGFVTGTVEPADADAIIDYTTDVPLHPSGAAAAAHGKGPMSPEALTLARQLVRRGTVTLDQEPTDA